MAQLIARCDGAARWRAESMATALSAGAVAWIAEEDKGIIGMILIRHATDEMEILNLAVAPEQRRKGIATRLLMQAIRHATRLGVKTVYLEVRAENEAGREFYASHRFKVCGHRENYYTAPVDDALIMRRDVKIFDGHSL